MSGRVQPYMAALLGPGHSNDSENRFVGMYLEMPHFSLDLKSILVEFLYFGHLENTRF